MFLSMFSDQMHSCKWCIRRHKDLVRQHKHSDFELVQCEIDGPRLARYTWIFRVEEMVEFLEVDTNDRPVDPDEYLVFEKIPRSTIFGKLSGNKFKEFSQYT